MASWKPRELGLSVGRYCGWLVAMVPACRPCEDLREAVEEPRCVEYVCVAGAPPMYRSGLDLPEPVVARIQVALQAVIVAVEILKKSVIKPEDLGEYQADERGIGYRIIVTRRYVRLVSAGSDKMFGTADDEWATYYRSVSGTSEPK